nr:MAG TPA: hypothetical protein [Caudoviricetes sp.]
MHNSPPAEKLEGLAIGPKVTRNFKNFNMRKWQMLFIV